MTTPANYATIKQAWEASGIDGIYEYVDALPVARRGGSPEEYDILCGACAAKAVELQGAMARGLVLPVIEEDGTFGVRECDQCGAAVRGAQEGEE